jgi:hypothetical protein
LTHNILVLLVLVVRSVRLDDTFAINAVNRAGDTSGSDESSKVTMSIELVFPRHHTIKTANLPIKEINCNTEIVCHAFQTDDTVAL